MNESAPKSIVIVGGGASATLLIAQLSTHLNTHSLNPIDIYVINDSEAFKVGLAYSIEDPSFILNVAANRMGAWADKPDDFYQWLKNYPQLWRNLHSNFTTCHYDAEDFVPRMIYGAYLRWIFDCAVILAAEKNINIHRISARVASINTVKYSSKLLVKTDNQELLHADAVIVATGNSTPKHTSLQGENIFTSPYHRDFIQQDWTKIKNIIVVGSGLSMVDAVQYLAQQNYQGNIHIFSRNSLLPLPHLSTGQHQEITPFTFKGLTSARQIIRAIRSLVIHNSAQGISWQITINGLRANSNAVWLSLDPKERKKLSRVLPWWNISRHRIPIAAYELLIKLQQEGRLTITKGEIKHGENDGEYFLLNLHHKTAFIKADKMVICSGYSCQQNIKKLCGSLVNRETLHSLNDYRLSKNYALFAVGPALGNLLFETTAINEIRQQCLSIASQIAEQADVNKQVLKIPG